MHEAEYFTHNNYSLPYRVVVAGNWVRVYRAVLPDVGSTTYEAEPCFDREVLEVMRGDSPENAMTTFSAGFGPTFDGNSFLFCVGEPSAAESSAAAGSPAPAADGQDGAAAESSAAALAPAANDVESSVVAALAALSLGAADAVAESSAAAGSPAPAADVAEPSAVASAPPSGAAWTYVHVGKDVIRFTTDAEIVKYWSPVGNNRVPYAYAIDAADRVLLLSHDRASFAPEPELLEKYAAGTDDPYQEYWDLARITRDDSWLPPKEPVLAGFRGIVEWQVNGEAWTLKYEPGAAKRYDWLCESTVTITAEADEMGDPADTPIAMALAYEDGTTQPIGRAEFVEFLEAFGEHADIRPLNPVTIAAGFAPHDLW